jgi:UDP-glucose 4-epimerase
MKNILVTGGLGFIGSHTSVVLHEAGYYPIIVDDLSNSAMSVSDGLKEIMGERPYVHIFDYRDTQQLSDLFDTENIEGIIHFAAFKAVGQSINEPLKYYENNVAGFVGLLKIAEERGVPVVFSSSATVYGPSTELPLAEDTELLPATNPYGATKQMCEIILRDTMAASKRTKAVALRYFNPIGAHPSGNIGELPIGIPANLVPFVTQAAAGVRDKLTVFGNDYSTPDGSCIRDYVHVMDLADAHVRALEYLDKQANGFYDVFNVGTGKGVSVLEIINTFEKSNGVKVPYQVGPRRAGDVAECYADVGKIEKTMGWKATRSLEDGLKDAWAWQQKLTQKS